MNMIIVSSSQNPIEQAFIVTELLSLPYGSACSFSSAVVAQGNVFKSWCLCPVQCHYFGRVSLRALFVDLCSVKRFVRTL
jgi:hypothetical protein